MGLRQLLSGLVLVIAFSIASIFFMLQMIEQNNPTGVISNEATVNLALGDLNSTVSDLTTTVKNAKENLDADTPSILYPFLIIYTAYSIPKAFLIFMVHALGNITGLVFPILFGGGQFAIITSIISGVLMIAIIFLLIRAWRTGDSEN